MPRGKPPAGITIGFIGTGEMEPDAAIDLIEEYINESINADEPATFVFPLTNTEFTDTLDKLAEMARKSRIAYEVITNPDDKKRRAFNEVAQGASNQYLVTDVFTQMETILTEAAKSALFMLWDEKRDDELQGVAARFIDAEIDVRDLTSGLMRLGVGQDEGEEGEGPEEADEGEEDEGDDEAQEVRELEAEALSTTLYTRAALEKMPHAEVKDIAVGMGLPPRKARENMILAILEAQGEAQTVTVAPVRSQTVTPLPVQQEGFALDLTGLREVLDDFGERFMVGLDEWLTKFSTAAEGWAFNMKPEEPMSVEHEPEEPTKRPRLVRSPR